MLKAVGALLASSLPTSVPTIFRFERPLPSPTKAPENVGAVTVPATSSFVLGAVEPIPTLVSADTVIVELSVLTLKAGGRTDLLRRPELTFAASMFVTLDPLPTKAFAVIVPVTSNSLVGAELPIPTRCDTIVIIGVVALTLKATGSALFGSLPSVMRFADKLDKELPLPEKLGAAIVEVAVSNPNTVVFPF